MKRWRLWALLAFMACLFVYVIASSTPGWDGIGVPLGLAGGCCSAAAYLGGRVTFR